MTARRRETGMLRGTMCAAAVVFLASGAPAAETVRVGGTGMGLAWAAKAARLFKAEDPETNVEVLPSLGTPGGLRALVAGELEVAIAARPISVDEKLKGLREAACIKSAFVFATSRPTAPGIELGQLPGIYGELDPRWPDGQPLKIILRSPAGSENAYLTRLAPGMREALAAAARRTGIPVAATDQENVEFLHRTAGSFGLATLLQVRSESLDLTLLPVNGVEASATSIADGTYPMAMVLCFVTPGNPSAGADKFIRFLRSAAGRDLARAYGAEPIE